MGVGAGVATLRDHGEIPPDEQPWEYLPWCAGLRLHGWNGSDVPGTLRNRRQVSQDRKGSHMRPAAQNRKERGNQREAVDREITDRAAQLMRQALSLLESGESMRRPPLEDGGDEDRLLRLPEVLRLTGMCRSALYDQMARGHFPSSIKIGQRATSWSAKAVRNWIAQRVDGL